MSNDFTLYRESAAFVRRLDQAVKAFGESAYASARRTNWSYRYAAEFQDFEGQLYAADPDGYLAVPQHPAPVLEDVYGRAVERRKLLETLLKVAAHWLFRLLGNLRVGRRDTFHIYRKCYVDDVENVFDPDEPGVLRHVFPFPLNLGRQWRYLKTLRRAGKPFRFAGYPYSVGDVVTLLRRRDIRSLRRLEARAQIRLGRSLVRQQWTSIQLSDEFDICSLDFVRSLKRPGLRVINSAHGVGKYFPIHAYDEFRILTHRQEEYYRAIARCRYVMGHLLPSRPPATATSTSASAPLQLVFVSQTSSRTGTYLDQCEHAVLESLAHEFGGRHDIELLIKPHPNRSEAISAEAFAVLPSISNLGCPEKTVFVSFFSTSHMDPAFRGRRFLLSYGLIRPSISFDDDGSIVTLDQLKQRLSDALLEFEP